MKIFAESYTYKDKPLFSISSLALAKTTGSAKRQLNTGRTSDLTSKAVSSSNFKANLSRVANRKQALFDVSDCTKNKHTSRELIKL